MGIARQCRTRTMKVKGGLPLVHEGLALQLLGCLRVDLGGGGFVLRIGKHVWYIFFSCNRARTAVGAEVGSPGRVACSAGYVHSATVPTVTPLFCSSSTSGNILFNLPPHSPFPVYRFCLRTLGKDVIFRFPAFVFVC